MLKTTEELIWKFVTAPEGVEKELRKNRTISLPIVDDSRLSAVKRLDIYANMYFFRIRDSLKKDFPTVFETLGPDRFHNLVTDYLLAFPPTHWSLRYVGENLPSFLKNHETRKKIPFLSDLARLEWQILESFDTLDTDLLTKEKLAAIPLADWNQLLLQITPSFSIHSFEWPVDQIYDSPSKEVSPEETTVKVWRKEWKVFFKRIDLFERELFRRLKEPVSLGDLCEIVAKKKGTDGAVPWVTEFLHQAIFDETFRDLEKSPKKNQTEHPDP